MVRRPHGCWQNVDVDVAHSIKVIGRSKKWKLKTILDPVGGSQRATVVVVVLAVVVISSLRVQKSLRLP